MKIRSLIALCCVIFLSYEVFAEGENEVKRGLFPFMAFLYYPDESVVEATGARFLRGAVLIRPQWLISSAIDHSIVDNVPLGFPRKTLLARLGAISIDANFTLNEDEDEQEREVIQIVRPTIHNIDVWWFTDITLLKTLLPFNLTSAVTVTAINPKRDYVDKNCIILVYAKKYGNMTEEKVLMQLSVELLPPSIENCGNQFSQTTMTCALDSDETKSAIYDPDFCQGNSGGPLMCEGEVMGLQTYIDNNCKQPHLYQVLSSWDNILSCSTQEKCHLDYCSNICAATNKDNPVTDYSSLSNSATMSTPPIQEVTELAEGLEETTTVPAPASEIQTIEETSSIVIETTEPQTVTISVTTTTESITAETITTSTVHDSESTTAWPNEKPMDARKMAESEEATAPERAPPKLEELKQMRKPRVRSAADRNMCLIQSLFLGILILKCVI